MPFNMEGPVDNNLFEQQEESKRKLKKLLADIEAEHPHKARHQTLEEAYGPEKAARMRKEAEQYRNQTKDH